MRSRVAICLARMIGLYSAGSAMHVPSRRFVVTAAAAASVVYGSAIRR